MSKNYISVNELKEKLKLDTKPVLIDVREKYELSDKLGIINGIINIPIGSISSNLEELQKYKENSIVIICRSGSRATIAAQILSKASFYNVVILEGGMLAWSKSTL